MNYLQIVIALALCFLVPLASHHLVIWLKGRRANKNNHPIAADNSHWERQHQQMRQNRR